MAKAWHEKHIGSETDPAAVWVPVADLKPWAKNPRKNDKAVDKVAESIRAFGFGAPLLARKANGEIIAGHTRIRAAEKVGLERVPVRFLDISEEQAHLLALADNRLGEIAAWDDALLGSVLADLKAEGADLALSGFAENELAKLVEQESAGNGDPDDVPEPPATPITKPGDLWALGAHRLLCGDSTSASDVGRLMAGERAALMQTDPPYGIAYVQNAKSKGQAVAHADIANDELDGEKLQAFLEATIRAVIPHLSDACAFYLWHPMLTQGTFFAAAAAADILIHRQIIWCKPSMVFGRGDYHWQHELCFYGWRRGHRPPFYGERNQTTLWMVGRETSKQHPTAKPVDLWDPPIANHTRAGEVMYEPFAGSGSQLIAAERAGRRCFAMELSPNYCDVIVERWEKFTGRKAERIDGQLLEA
jgi:DNA modification methylase